MTEVSTPNGKCGICSLTPEKRYRIELSLADGTGTRAIAKKYGVSRDTAWRHLTFHMSAERRALLTMASTGLKPLELAEMAATESVSLFQMVKRRYYVVWSLMLKAAEDGDKYIAGLLNGRLAECERIMAQLSGEASRSTQHVTNNMLILASPVMDDMRSMLLRRLAAYPEARESVIEGLEELASRALPNAPVPLLETVSA